MEIIHALQSVASPALDLVALAVTNLGHEMTYVGLLVIAYLAVGADQGRRLGILVLLSFYLNGLLKGVFDTPRPYVLDPEVLRSQAAAQTGPGAGFPSGHAQGAMAFWGVSALYVRRRPFTALALVLVAAIALSRVYLGVHLPIDIVGGLGIGALFVLAAAWWPERPLRLAAPLQIALGIAVPLALQLIFSNDHSGLVLGGMAGFLTAPLLLKHEAPRTLSGRFGIALLGLTLVFAALFGSSALLPEAVKRSDIGAFLRYLALAYVGRLLVPALWRQVRRQPAAAT